MPVAINHLRIARPVSDLERSKALYCQGLGLQVLGGFKNHAGFDGVMLGDPALDWHLEFTHCHRHEIEPHHSVEDLLVLYVADPADFQALCERLADSGFARVAAFNPYWQENGVSFVDHDGYRVVVARVSWPELEPTDSI
ncbi:VOC family protein [Pseudomonas sp. S75]|uniref:VOC family protein n=1 Tax=unclassified Pseudomonas TaxID=196821 RepID=UPI00190657E6|nr:MULTISPECIES: VOC family protein [unclassified Pseudomonas]MBJ9977086.1 VOC family protein [Pseudomonas sp. S30]MBK0154088.1 VOC family protein [Pseudomonas sp. S75]